MPFAPPRSWRTAASTRTSSMSNRLGGMRAAATRREPFDPLRPPVDAGTIVDIKPMVPRLATTLGSARSRRPQTPPSAKNFRSASRPDSSRNRRCTALPVAELIDPDDSFKHRSSRRGEPRCHRPPSGGEVLAVIGRVEPLVDRDARRHPAALGRVQVLAEGIAVAGRQRRVVDRETARLVCEPVAAHDLAGLRKRRADSLERSSARAPGARERSSAGTAASSPDARRASESLAARTGRLGREPRAPRIVARVEGPLVGRAGRAAGEQLMADRRRFAFEQLADAGDGGSYPSRSETGGLIATMIKATTKTAAKNQRLSRGSRRLRDSFLNQSWLSTPTPPTVIRTSESRNPPLERVDAGERRHERIRAAAHGSRPPAFTSRLERLRQIELQRRRVERVAERALGGDGALQELDCPTGVALAERDEALRRGVAGRQLPAERDGRSWAPETRTPSRAGTTTLAARNRVTTISITRAKRFCSSHPRQRTW